MVAIPFPLSSAPGTKPQEGAGRLVNAYVEKTGEGARSPVVWLRSPGLRNIFDATSHTHFRGGILVNSTLLVAMDSRVYSVTESGGVYTVTNLGALSGTDRVTTARNNAATPNIACVTSAGAFNLFTGGAPTSFADADLPQPNSVCSLDGYLIFGIGDGRIFATGLNAVTVSSSSYTTEQGLALRRVVTFRGEVFAFGDKWTGVYRNAGTSPFPLERRTFTIARGIAGTHAVAGWEDGWANELIWVGEDNVVYRMNGYSPTAISTPDVVRAIQSCADTTLLEASVYMTGGNAMWALTSPSEWTWEYNLTTGQWNERQSYNRDDWRGCGTIKAFDQWIAGDRTTGDFYKIDSTYYKENGASLAWEVTSGVVANFPARLGTPRADFDLTAAVGDESGEDPIETDPTVLISWSEDGGYSYGNTVSRAIGGEGESKKLVTVNRIGLSQAKGRRFKLRVSDPVHVGLTGAQMVAETRAE